MEELLNSVDFAVDFDMDTSNLDCLSDDLLDTLNEDDLLNIDLLSEYEDLEESQVLGGQLLSIDSFFVQDQSESDYKTSKVNSIASFLISPFGLSPNPSTQLTGNSSISHHSSHSYSSSIGYPQSTVSHCSSLAHTSSIAHQLNYRSQSQLLNKENSMTDDSYCSSDEDSISSILLDDPETSPLEDGVRAASRFGQSDKNGERLNRISSASKRANESSAAVLSRNQTRCQTRFQSKVQQAKCQPKRLGQSKCKSTIYGQEESDVKQPKRKLSSKGTSLLAKPKCAKKISDSFARYFAEEHNYCFYV